MFASEGTIIRDTISVIDSGQVAAFYSDILEEQSALCGHMITVVIAVFTVLLGVSWWWNTRGVKNQLKAEVKSAKNVLKGQLDSWEEKSIEEIKSELSKKEVELSERLQKEMKHHEAELDRLYAVSCVDRKNFICGAEWLIRAFCLYMEEDKGASMEVCLKNFVEMLKEAVKADSFDDDTIERLDSIEKGCKRIPDVYSSKRTEACKIIKEIRRKFSNQAENKEKK